MKSDYKKDLEHVRQTEEKYFFEIGIEPFLAIEDNEPSTIFTFCLPEQGLYEENKLEWLVIWSEAPESTIQISFEQTATFKAFEKLPVWAKKTRK